MDLMCKCQRQEQQVADLRKLIDEIAKLEAGAPDISGGDNSGNWETQSVCSDVSGVGLSFSSSFFSAFPCPPPAGCPAMKSPSERRIRLPAFDLASHSSISRGG